MLYRCHARRKERRRAVASPPLPLLVAGFLLAGCPTRLDPRADPAQPTYVGEPGASGIEPSASAPEVPSVSANDEMARHVALAESEARSGSPVAALLQYGWIWQQGSPAERAWARDRASALAASLPAAQVLPTYRGMPSESLGRAALARRAAQADSASARDILQEGEAARRHFGYAPDATTRATRAVGVVLPLSGRSRLLGERVLRGALLAGGELVGAGMDATPAVELLVRDSGSRPEQAAAALDELAREGVAAVVGSPDKAEAAALGARAATLGIPLLDLSPGETRSGSTSFRLLRPNEARATALADQAVRAGARKVAILRPDNAYGQKMAEAFAATLEAHQAIVVANLSFDERATTFIAPAKKLAALRPDAVFVPTTAAQLELIAAQLAASGVTRAQSARGSAATLYATADALAAAQLMVRAGRYVQGAVLAPVFYADDSPVVARFREEFGDEPGPVDALAYDAVSALRAVVTRLDPTLLTSDGVLVHDAIAAALVSGQSAGHSAGNSVGGAVGITGPLSFTDDGNRAGAPVLFVVEGDGIRPLATP